PEERGIERPRLPRVVAPVRVRYRHLHCLPCAPGDGAAERTASAVHLVDADARIRAHPRVSVGCPYTGAICAHRVRQRPPGSLRFFTHAMGRGGGDNAWKVNRTLWVGGSPPLRSTLFGARLRAL